MKRSNNGLKRIIQISLLASVATLLMLIQIPYPGAGWLKFDISNIPVLIGGCALGPIAGLLIVIIKLFLFGIIRSSPGELMGLPMNLIANGTLVLVTSYIYRRVKTQENALFSLFVGVIVSTLIMIPANYFVLPLYLKFFAPNIPIPPPSQMLTMLFTVVIPFNLIAGFLNISLTFIVYKRVSAFIRPDAQINLQSGKDVRARSRG
ncbi:MAG: ECF transporter S component [Candidatus Eremiobacteraeota bacterium]|nr:ECF transporter S component [Candidatus Eremiobacteraeota bacterium]